VFTIVITAAIIGTR